MIKTEPSRPAGIAIAVFFLAASITMLALVFLSSHWWLPPAFLAGLIGVVGLGVELGRPSARVVVHPVGSAEAAALLRALDEVNQIHRRIDERGGNPRPVRPVSDEARMGAELLDRDAVRAIARELDELRNRWNLGLLGESVPGTIADLAARAFELAGPA